MAESQPLTPREIGAIISAYTGILIGEFSAMQEYVEKLFGRGVWTHEFASKEFSEEIKKKAFPDFARVHEWCGGKP